MACLFESKSTNKLKKNTKKYLDEEEHEKYSV